MTNEEEGAATAVGMVEIGRGAVTVEGGGTSEAAGGGRIAEGCMGCRGRLMEGECMGCEDSIFGANVLGGIGRAG